MHDRAQWSNYIDLRIGILDRSGLLAGSRPLRIFEIGCAEGVLLGVLRKRGHRAEGCETNRVVAAFGRRELGVDIIDEPFESAPVDLAAYDVVVSYHTFEHLSDPARVLTRCGGFSPRSSPRWSWSTTPTGAPPAQRWDRYTESAAGPISIVPANRTRSPGSHRPRPRLRNWSTRALPA